MITIYDERDAQQLSDPTLRALVQRHLVKAKKNGLENLTCVAVVEPSDDEKTFIAELGFSPLRNPLTETHFGDPAFIPAWDWLEVHPDWFELIFTVGDDGFAFIALVPKSNQQFRPICDAWAATSNPL